MRRFKLFAVPAAMMMITVGVFANKAKFAPQDVYMEISTSNRVKLVGTTSFLDLSTAINGNPATIHTSVGGQDYPLVTNDAGTWKSLYTQGTN